MSETIKKLKKEFNKEYVWSNESETITEIQWLIQWHGWFLLCRMDKEYPYAIRYRLIGYREYNKDKPNVFVDKAKELLLHYRKYK